jgi:integrase/recombinase XerD
MIEQQFGALSLFSADGDRKYLNAAERRRFRQSLNSTPVKVRLFCFILYWTGSRISEALALTPAAIDLDSCIATLQTLKRRRKGVMRQVPLPRSLVRELDRTFALRERQRDSSLASQRLWPWSRVTAWRRVKTVMIAAEVTKSAAMPKGLRHSFGVVGFQNSIPPHLVQRWLGHASLETTAIYGDVAGREEREFAARLWNRGHFIRALLRRLLRRDPPW